MNRFCALLLLLTLTACDGGDSPAPQPQPQPQPSSVWTIGPIIDGVNYSPGVVWDGSGFVFPTAAPGVHGLTRPSAGDGRAQITMQYRIDGDDATFVEVDAGGGTPGPGKVRLFLQRCDDDWRTMPSHRFYSQPLDLAVGDATMQVALTSDLWTNVNGQNDADGFAAALGDLCTVGMGFGGMFAMHGVYAIGNARFNLISYVVN